jgi:hypothetical protein
MEDSVREAAVVHETASCGRGYPSETWALHKFMMDDGAALLVRVNMS